MKKSSVKIIIPIILIAIVAIGIIIFICIRNTRTVNEEEIISQEQFSQYIKEIPITTENWQDYIYLEDVKEEKKNAFGDIESTYITTRFKLKDNNMYTNVALKITVNNKEIIVETIENHYTDYFYTPHYYMEDKNPDKTIFDYTITEKDFKCVQTKGSVYIVEIPDNLWQTDERSKDDNGNARQYIKVEKINKEIICYNKESIVPTLEREQQIKEGKL